MNLNLTKEDKDIFRNACKAVLEHERVRLGIGCLSEKPEMPICMKGTFRERGI